MVGIGFLYLALFSAGFYYINLKRDPPNWLLRTAVLAVPLPWIAAEFGWIVAEIGRQPWIIDGVLPTHLGVSSLSVGQVITTMVGFTAIYGVLLVIEMKLMLRAIRLGPDGGPIVTLGGGGVSDALGIPGSPATRSQAFDK
jgi:cytochrome d ubiquinol oxidase subunit I